MKRRQFIVGLGSAAVWPLAARAQQAPPVVGYLSSRSASDSAFLVEAFRLGLSETGYGDGHNVAFEFRWADHANDRLPGLAADLVHRKVTLIAASGGSVTALAAKATTSTIPIVFATGADPVAIGLVTSLNRPGGNLTGLTTLSTEVEPKLLQRLHEAIPTASNIALLLNPTSPAADIMRRDLQVAARTLGLQLHLLHASSESHLQAVFANLDRLRVGGLLIGADPFFNGYSAQLAALTVQHKVPAIFVYREFSIAGGLMSYGGNITDQHRRIGVYAGRILNGERPADLPVQQATKVELVINLKTAKALGLTIPETLLATADEVIQ